MEFLVSMHITLPPDLPDDLREGLYRREGVIARDYAARGFITRIWRRLGSTWNWMLWDVRDASQLQELLTGFPLFHYSAGTEVYALAYNANDPGVTGIPKRIRDEDEFPVQVTP